MPAGMDLDWILTLVGLAAFVGLAVFAGWKSGRPRKDSLNARWISWPLVTVFAATAAIFILIHVLGLMGVHTGQRALRGYPMP